MSKLLDELAKVASDFLRDEGVFSIRPKVRRITPATACPTCGESITIRSLDGRACFLKLHVRRHADKVKP